MADDVVRIWVSRNHLADLGWRRDATLYDPESREVRGTVEHITAARAGGVEVVIRPTPDQSVVIREHGRGMVLLWVVWHGAGLGEPTSTPEAWSDYLRSKGLI